LVYGGMILTTKKIAIDSKALGRDPEAMLL
jgi:hypothetical protein